MTEKHCPILVPLYHSGEADWEETLCQTVACAWWNEDFDCCGVIAQAKIMDLEFARREADEDQDY